MKPDTLAYNTHGRQLGLGTGSVIDGLATIADFVTSPFRVPLNLARSLRGGDPQAYNLRGKVPGLLGLPKPETPWEQFQYATQQGVASMMGGAALAGTKAGGAALNAAGNVVQHLPGVVTDVSRQAAAGLAARNLDKAAQVTADFAEGFLLPVSPSLSTPAGTAGAIAKDLLERYRLSQQKE